MDLRMSTSLQSSLSSSRCSFLRSYYYNPLVRLHPTPVLLNLGFVSISHAKALVRSELSKSQAKPHDEGTPLVPQPISIKIPVGNRHILVESGHIGRQASGSVSVTDGETMVYTSVCLANTPIEPSDVFPLSVHYQERFSAAGRTSGGFFKREGRIRDHEVLICRLIDRPLRPTLPKGFRYETQILSWVLSYDGVHSPGSLAVTAAGIAMALSEVPNSDVVAGVQIGMIGDEFIVNPTMQEMENSDLDMFLAGTVDTVLMVEGCCNFLSDKKFLEAVKVGQDAVGAICTVLESFVRMRGKVKMYDGIKLPDHNLYTHVENIAGRDIEMALVMKEKKERNKALTSLEAKLLEILTVKGYVPALKTSMPPELDDDQKLLSSSQHTLLYSDVDVKLVFKEVTRDFVRKHIVKEGKRSDGRNVNDIRCINSQCGFLPRAHGSALFTRGETQSLAVVTLGDGKMAQKTDNLIDGNDSKRFYLQYTFPPSCVGEIGRIGAPTRREIGHGVLAEKALGPILPSEDDFPYTIRVESTITESNGSSSMASVCGGCLALQDAGVPLKCSIAGIAMGMIFRTEEFGSDGKCIILSDINGLEDACGDMDFKIAGSEDGITAFQMDIKVVGLTLDIMKEALLKAKEGRKLVLAEMLKCSPPPSMQLSQYAPLIHVLKVNPDKINLIIGSGGKKVRNIIEETGIESIDADDEGQVTVVAKNRSSLEKCKAIISSLVMVPTVGAVYRNCEIKAMARYGIFVEIAHGWEGLCHVSELTAEWLARADVIKVGGRIDVKVLEVNEKGHIRLSHRAIHSNLDVQNSILHDHPHSLVEECTATGNGKNVDEISSMRSSASTSNYVDDDVLAAQRLVRRLVGSPSAFQNGRPKNAE